jgi:hypothetical protein
MKRAWVGYSSNSHKGSWDYLDIGRNEENRFGDSVDELDHDLGLSFSIVIKHISFDGDLEVRIAP